MSTLTVRLLTCDGTYDGMHEPCPAEYGGDPDVHALAALRRAAREAGWRKARGNRDLCPDCARAEGEVPGA